MIDRIKISDRLYVGAQPDEDQLRDMARDGIKAVVNLRANGEEDQPLSPEAEGVRAREQGLQYLHIPVSSKHMRPEQVDQFREELGHLPGPVFVHCHTGKRAGAFAMMHAAVEAGMTGEQALEQAERMGFECDVPALKEFVRGYVDRHRE